MENRPHAREKGEASGSGDVFRRGSGLGTGRVGTGGSGGGFDSGEHGSGKRSFGTGGGFPGGLAVLVIVIFLVLRGCGGLFGGLTGDSGTTVQEETGDTGAAVQQTAGNTAGSSSGNAASGTGNGYGTGNTQHTYVNADSETLDTSVSDKVRILRHPAKVRI